MSGGFFRGTSADQDTRFSNKMAKLLKTQKFAPELDHLVDMSKVKIDVIRPWIAKRVTELLGFEDEVLINFIFGLLEGKDVDGKHIQIQLTGFMEKNTGKFMKELWSLLTSAQNNISGVPQQLLDAKAEEAKKKMAEEQRIASELSQWKEEERKLAEHESKPVTNPEAAPFPKDRSPRIHARGSPLRELEPELKQSSVKDGFSRRSRSKERTPILRPRGDSHKINSRFIQSKSRSRSSSSSSSLSRSPRVRRRRFSRSRSQTPRRLLKPKSPARRVRSPVVPHSPPRSPPRRGRSPFAPYSPSRRRRPPVFSRSPRKRKSPVTRFPLKHWRRSPICIHSPNRSALSPSPQRRRFPSPRRRHSPSLSGSPSPPCGLRSHSRSPQRTCRNSSRERAGRHNGADSRKKNDHLMNTGQRLQLNSKMEKHETRSSVKQQTVDKFPRVRVEQATKEQNQTIAECRIASNSFSRKHRSLSASPSPRHDIKKSTYEETRVTHENRRSPAQNQVPHVLAMSKSKLEPTLEPHDDPTDDNRRKDMHGPYLSRTQEQGQKVYSKELNDFRGKEVKDTQLGFSMRPSSEGNPLLEDKRDHLLKRPHETIASTEVSVGGPRKHTGQILETTHPLTMSVVEDKDHEAHGQRELQKERKEDHDSSSTEDVRSDSPTTSDERRIARKRKKEEKRLRKEVRRRKRDEKHRRREERRASKAAFKEVASVTPPPDMDLDISMFAGPGNLDSGKEEHKIEDADMEVEQKRLENELRKKALDSLRAKQTVKS